MKSMLYTFTRTVTIKVTPESLGEKLDENSLDDLREIGFLRIQSAMGQLINQGMLIGILTLQKGQPAVNLHWLITVADEPSTTSES